MNNVSVLVAAILIGTSVSWAQTTHFSFVSNTGNNATVAIPTSANPTINGIPLQSGDEIGVFADGIVNPDSFCVGAVVWNGVNTAVTVWGDNDQTPQLDGIRAGTAIHFHIWQKSTNTEYSDVAVSYSEGNGVYAVNGIYVLSSMSVATTSSIPELLSPANGATVPSTSVSLVWGSLAGSTSYHIQVSTDSVFDTLIADDSTDTDTTFQISGLASGSRYYWHVSAKNNGSFGSYSAFFSFTTSSAIYLSLPIVQAVAGDTVLVPLNVVFPSDSSYSSVQISAEGFHGQMDFLGITDSGMVGGAGWLWEYNDTDSLFITASAGANDITGSGVLLWLKFFVPIEADTGFIPITLKSALFNTGVARVVLTSGGVKVAAPFVYGDVDLNGKVQAYDASLILKYLVGKITLDNDQLLRANVSLDTSISSLDASLILKYLVGLIDSLPYRPIDSSFIASGTIMMDTVRVQAGDTAVVPLKLVGGKNILSFEGELSYDPVSLKISAFDKSSASTGFYVDTSFASGLVRFAGAGSNAIEGDGSLATIKFVVDSSWIRATDTPISVTLTNLRWNAGPVLINVAKAVIILVPTDVQGSQPTVPSTCFLEQNYPNPFNPTTTIRYGLPHDGRVRLDVYNVLGERVKTLVDNKQTAGYHEVSFDGTNLPSGIYIYRLTANGFVSIMKMALIK